MPKQYLGDSVSVDFWEGGLVLTTEDGRPDDPSNTIFLEPAVYEALVQYVTSLKAEAKIAVKV